MNDLLQFAVLALSSVGTGLVSLALIITAIASFLR